MHSGDETAEILFVCTGNTCRSPLAEVVAKEALRQMGSVARVGSAGTAATAGAPASPHAIRVAREAGLDLSAHGARHVTPELLDGTALVLVMGSQHLREVQLLAPDVPARLLAEHAGGQPEEVADPFGGDLETYRRSFARIRQLVESSMRRFHRSVGSERI